VTCKLGLRGGCDGEDRHHYDGVHDRIKALDAGISDGDDEWGGLGVNVVPADQLWTRVGYNKANNGN
jgi:hypothetical protein